ncbi:hypothetical protein Dimus_025258 [Dionaea muscipula]
MGLLPAAHRGATARCPMLAVVEVLARAPAVRRSLLAAMEAAPLLAQGRALLARATARRERAAARPCHCSPGEGSQACRCSQLDGATRRRAAARSWMALLVGVPLLAGFRCSPSSFNCCKPLLAHGDTAGRSHAASVASTKQAGAAAHYLVSVSDAVTRCMISHCPLHGDWKAHSSTMLTALLLLTCMGLAQMLSWPHEWDGLQSILLATLHAAARWVTLQGGAAASREEEVSCWPLKWRLSCSVARRAPLLAVGPCCSLLANGLTARCSPRSHRPLPDARFRGGARTGARCSALAARGHGSCSAAHPGKGRCSPSCFARRERAAARRVIARRGGLASVPLPAAGWRYSQAFRCPQLDGATRRRAAARRLPLLAGRARCSPSSFNCCKPLLAHGDTAGCSHAASVASTKQASAAARYLVAVSDAVARCMISHCPLHGDWKAHSSTMLTALLLLTCMGLAQMLSWPHEWDGLQSIVAL